MKLGVHSRAAVGAALREGDELDRRLTSSRELAPPRRDGATMIPSALTRPHTVVTLALVGFAVMSLGGCRNLFQVCGPALVITPNFDSTSVGGTVTFQALAEGGGCGFAKTEAATADAVWRVKDTTVARISAITSDDLVTVTGVRPGETPIVAFWQGLMAVAYFQVN